METLLAVSVGLGLAAAAGMRVFLPLFVLGLAGSSGLVPLASGWEWVASSAALIGLATATALEIAAYYVPWVDQALDVVATPAAVMAGMIATASVLVDVPPLLSWAVVIVGGGGVAGLTQGMSVLTRLKSTTLTGGMANPIVSTVEWVGALVVAATAVLLPFIGLALGAMLLVYLVHRARRLRRASPRKPMSPS